MLYVNSLYEGVKSFLFNLIKTILLKEPAYINMIKAV